MGVARSDEDSGSVEALLRAADVPYFEQQVDLVDCRAPRALLPPAFNPIRHATSS